MDLDSEDILELDPNPVCRDYREPEAEAKRKTRPVAKTQAVVLGRWPKFCDGDRILARKRLDFEEAAQHAAPLEFSDDVLRSHAYVREH